jgi:hypothetical protein
MKRPLDELVRAFGNEVVLQELAASRGDPATGNDHAGKYFAAFDSLYAQGDDGLHAATTLLRDERANVRSVAAGLLMDTLMAERHRTERGEAVLEEAVAVLQEVATGKGLTAFSAGRALARWTAKAKARSTAKKKT